MIALEIISMIAAVAALVMAFLAAYTDHAKAKDGLASFRNTTEEAETARASAKALHEQADRLSNQGNQEEAKRTIAQRDKQYRHAESLEALNDQPAVARVEEQVTFSRRALSRALLAAGLGTLSALAGGWSGIAGANQSSADRGDPNPTRTPDPTSTVSR